MAYDEKLAIEGIISEKDPDSRIIKCNTTFMMYAGVPSDNLILGYTDYDFPWAESADIYRKHELDILAGDVYSTIIPLRDVTSVSRLFLHNKVPIYDDMNNIVGIKCHALELINPTVTRLFQYIDASSLQKPNAYYLNKQESQFRLTKRERQVLFYLLRGHTAKKVAQNLGLAPRTVQFYIENIKQKLNCTTKDQVIECALAHGLAAYLP